MTDSDRPGPPVGPPDDVPFPPQVGERGASLVDLAAELGALRARQDQQGQEITGLRDQLAARDAEIRDLRGLGGAVGKLSQTVQAAAVLPAMAAREAADEEGTVPAGVWSWASATRVERADRIREVGDWLFLVIRPRYPIRTAGILACWAWHPAVQEELSWLYGCWLDVYASQTGTYTAAGDWHDRWLDGVLRRFKADSEFGECEQRHGEQLAAAKSSWLAPTWQIYQGERRAAVWEAYELFGSGGDTRFMSPEHADAVSAELLPEVGLDWDDTTRRYIPEFIYCRSVAETERARVEEAYDVLRAHGDARYGRADVLEDVAAQLGRQLGIDPQTVVMYLLPILPRAGGAPPAR